MKGGGIHVLPGVSKMKNLDEYEKKYTTLFLSGHGTTLDNLFKVPDNMYILNLVNIGEPCEVLNWNTLFYDFKSEGYAKHFLDFIKKPSDYLNIYNPFNTKPDIKYNSKTSIYEPGDIIHDAEIHFNNTTYFSLFGILELPISNELQTLEEYNYYYIKYLLSQLDKELNTHKNYNKRIKFLRKNEELIRQKIKEFDTEYLKIMDKHLFAKMIQDKKTDIFTLQEILNKIKSYYVDKKLFIIVEACRGLKESNLNKNEYNYASRVLNARRRSFSIRQFYEKGSFVEIKNEEGILEYGIILNPTVSAEGKIKVRKGYTNPVIDLIDLDSVKVIGEPKPIHPLHFHDGDSVILHGLDIEEHNEILGTIVGSEQKIKRKNGSVGIAYTVMPFNASSKDDLLTIDANNLLYNYEVHDSVIINLFEVGEIVSKNPNGTFIFKGPYDFHDTIVSFKDLDRPFKKVKLNNSNSIPLKKSFLHNGGNFSRKNKKSSTRKKTLKKINLK